jgi:Flp pilus assembly protein TadG
LVEFALVIPIFMLVLSGILDFGFMLYSRMTVINAAREGARAAVIAPDATTIPTVVLGRVRSVMAGLATSDPPLHVPTPTCVAIKTASPPGCTWATTSSSQPGDAVSVTVDYTYTSFFPLLFGSTFHLVSTVQMVLE